MGIIRPNDPAFMTADEAAQRRTGANWGARSELALRNAIEKLCRDRWPNARVCHEMVMGERKVRADVVAVDIEHIAAFEVKGGYDDTSRLLHQVAMYQLCVPEVWMVIPNGKHSEDAAIIRHLLPSIGLLVGTGTSAANHYEFDGTEFGLAVEAEPVPRPVHVEMMLEMLWREELAAACRRTRCFIPNPRSTRRNMVKALLCLPTPQLQREVCTELRARNALWRADPPILGKGDRRAEQ